MQGILVAVKGAGDLATGVIHRLTRAGFAVMATELPAPTVVRRTVSFAEAVALGIATRTLPGGEVLEHAMTVARDIAVNVAPMSAALSKRLLWDTMIHGYTPRQVAELETQLHHRVMGGADAREGVEAFLQRRQPRWSASVAGEWKPLPDIRIGDSPDTESNGRKGNDAYRCAGD